MIATSTTATTEAVSTLPTGGNMRRRGRIRGLVSRTMACAIGLRKSARAHCNKSRANTTNKASDSSVSTMKTSALMQFPRGVESSESLGAELRGELAAAAHRGLEGASDAAAQVRSLEGFDRRFGRSTFGSHFRPHAGQVTI